MQTTQVTRSSAKSQQRSTVISSSQPQPLPTSSSDSVACLFDGTTPTLTPSPSILMAAFLQAMTAQFQQNTLKFPPHWHPLCSATQMLPLLPTLMSRSTTLISMMEMIPPNSDNSFHSASLFSTVDLKTIKTILSKSPTPFPGSLEPPRDGTNPSWTSQISPSSTMQPSGTPSRRPSRPILVNLIQQLQHPTSSTTSR
jgi:hypothetical protein